MGKNQLGPNNKIIERRKKLMRLRFVKRWPIEQISQVLGVSIKTVERDIKAIGEYGQQIGAELMRESVEQTLWKITINYHERQMLRWQEYANAKEARVKTSIINDVSADEERYYKLLQSMGVVLKAPEKFDVRQVQSWADIAAMVEAVADEQDNSGTGKSTA